MDAGISGGGDGQASIPPAMAFGQIQDGFYGSSSRHFFHGRQR
jgi:hypothetical protein